jgi:hypothetical protein
VAPRARRTAVPRRSPGPHPRPCSSQSPSARQTWQCALGWARQVQLAPSMLQRSSAAQAQSLLSPPSRTVAPRARRTTVPRRSPGPYPRPCSSHSPSARRPGEVFAHQQQQPSPWSPLDRSRRRQQQPQQHSNSRPRAEATRLEPSESAREPRQSRPESRAARRPERRATPVREPCHAGPSAVPTSRPESRRCSRCSPSRPRAKRRAWSRRSRPESRARAGQSARESNTQLLASVPNLLCSPFYGEAAI